MKRAIDIPGMNVDIMEVRRVRVRGRQSPLGRVGENRTKFSKDICMTYDT